VTREDFYELRQIAAHLSDLTCIGVFSPLRSGEGERKIFPRAMRLPRRRWNLNLPDSRRFDLLVAANVFMYSPDPARWFRNVLASCKYFLLLDVVRRRRSENNEFGTDGDRMRYAVGDAPTRTATQFDLGVLGDRLLGYRTYYGGANAHDDKPLHVLALLRGDLAEPILCLDDYPTDTRPLPQDLSPLHAILKRVEERELRFYLGIAPALVTDEMFGFLDSLKHAIPAVHGYDHAYSKDGPIYETESDPLALSAREVNEFAGLSYDVVVDRLREGRRLLEDRLDRRVETFILPHYMAHRRTGRALVEAGYTSYLSEKRIRGCSLPWIRSDFNGRSDAYDAGDKAEVVALHTTWEADVVRHGNVEAFERLLDELVGRRQRERQRGVLLGTLVAGRPLDQQSP
jgi:hypothetical protein